MNGRRAANKKAQITHDELRKAVNKYLSRGGNIRRLPDQKTIASSLIGGRWSNSELEPTQFNS